MKKRVLAFTMSLVAACSLSFAAPQQAHASTVKETIGSVLKVPAVLTVLVAAHIALYNALVDARLIEPLRRIN